MEPELSIIVPVYRVERYLEDCIGSILRQSYRNFELILVDDGSPDRSIDIMKNFEKSDRRVRIVRKANGGLSSARNAGLEAARGRYIGFVDGDDRVDPDFFEKMVNGIREAGSDLAICPLRRVEEGKTYLIDGALLSMAKEMSGEEFLSGIFRFQITPSVCSKVFRRTLFGTLRFQPGVNNEDFLLMLEMVKDPLRVTVVKDTAYDYIDRGESITTSLGSSFKADVFRHAEKAMEEVKVRWPNLVREGETYYFGQAYLYLEHLSRWPEGRTSEVYRRTRGILKENLKVIRNNPFIRKKSKILIYTLVFAPGVHNLVKGSMKRAGLS